MRSASGLLLICICFSLLTGCVKPPQGEADLRGEITRVGQAVGANVVQILVEERPGVEDGSDKAYVLVLKDEAVLRRAGDDYGRARISDLEEGLLVEIWFDGPVAESYPLQGTARNVVIVAP